MTDRPGDTIAEGERLTELLDKFAADDHEQTADALEALRNRLGRDGLSVDEWNALVGAASYLHVEAWRRRARTASSTREGL